MTVLAITVTTVAAITCMSVSVTVAAITISKILK